MESEATRLRPMDEGRKRTLARRDRGSACAAHLCVAAGPEGSRYGGSESELRTK